MTWISDIELYIYTQRLLLCCLDPSYQSSHSPPLSSFDHPILCVYRHCVQHYTHLRRSPCPSCCAVKRFSVALQLCKCGSLPNEHFHNHIGVWHLQHRCHQPGSPVWVRLQQVPQGCEYTRQPSCSPAGVVTPVPAMQLALPGYLPSDTLGQVHTSHV